MKKLISMFIVITLLLQPMMVSANTVFKDVSTNHWAESHINQLVDKGIINGYGDGTFKPNKEITVDEFIKLTITALGYYPDTSKTGYWADPYITKAKELKLITQAEITNFKRAIKREEMASIVVNAYSLKNTISQDNLKTVVRDSLKDYSLINDYYKDVVLTAYKEGLITGKSKNTFDPRGFSTRAEASVVIMRLLDESLRKPFDFGNKSFTYVTVDEWDEDMGWVKNQYKYYAPINDRKESVDEVITLHDRIKAIEKQNYGYFDIIYNPFEQVIASASYPSIETLNLPANEMVSHMDMGLTIRSLDFKEGRYPYSLVIWRDSRHYEDMTTYYNYIDDRYGEFMDVFAEVLFDKEADKVLSIIKRVLNNTKQGIVQEEHHVINNRNVYLASNNGLSIFVSDKISK